MPTRTHRVPAAKLAFMALVLLACSFSSAGLAQENEIGIYFDTNGIQSCRADGLFMSIDGYVIIKGCTEPSGISGWECRFSVDSGIYITQGELYGQGLNVASFPEMSVGLRQPLPHSENIVLMSFTIFAVSPGGLSLGPASRSSLPDAMSPIIAAGDSPGVLLSTTYRLPPEVGPLATVGLNCDQDRGDGLRSQDPVVVLAPRMEGDCGEDTSPPSKLAGWDVTVDPCGVAIDPAGTIFVTDPAADLIHRYDGPDRLPSSWQCRPQPHWLAWDAVNELLYVSSNLLVPIVQVFNRSGTLIREIGDYPYSAEVGHFAGPAGAIALDANGYLYVEEHSAISAPYDHRIQVFGPTGQFDHVVVAFSGYSIPPEAGQWFNCEDLAIATNGEMLVLDSGTGIPGQDFNRVHRLAPNGYPIQLWGENGEAPGQLDYPANLALDSSGAVWITSGTRLMKFAVDGTPLLQVSDVLGTSLKGIALSSGPVDYIFVGAFHEGVAAERIDIYSAPILAHNILDTSWQGPDHKLIANNVELLTECSDGNALMTGVAADGVAPLLLRRKFTEPCTVDWWLIDPENEDTGEGNGRLSTLDGTQTGQGITTSTQSVNGEHFAFVLYEAPFDFDRAGVPADNARAQRRVRVKLQFVPDAGGPSGDLWRDLTIIRPPVSFVHGLWGGPQSWRSFSGIRGDARWTIDGGVAPNWDFIDYHGSHGMGFAENAATLQSGMVLQKITLRESGYAAAKVDLIAHSMGGCVARTLAASDQSRRNDNYGEGDFHKLLTLNTPHWGSEYAEIIAYLHGMVAASDQFVRGTAALALRLMACAMQTSYDQITASAIDDLQPGSEALQSLPELSVPCHVVGGTGGSDLEAAGLLSLSMARDPSAAIYVLVKQYLGAGALEGFESRPHDAIVLLDSQRGGTDLGQLDVISGFSGLHTQATKTEDAGAVAEAWALRSVADDNYFGVLPPPQAPSTASALLEPQLPSYGGRRIQLVASAASGSPGQEVAVTVEGIEGAQVARAFLAFPGGGLNLEAPTLSGSVPVPVDACGSISVQAVALLSDGTFVDGEAIAIDVDLSAATLNALSVEPSSVLLNRMGMTKSITVYGHYSDGVSRDLGPLGEDLYVSYDQQIVAFHPADFAIQAIGAGTTTLHISYLGRQVSVPIVVQDGPMVNNPPHARAGGWAVYCGGRELILDGSGSYDYDTALGDQLAYSWDLDGDGIFDDAFGVQPSVLIDDDSADLVAALRVSDQAGAWTDDCILLSAENGFCHDAIAVCDVGHDDPQYQSFGSARDIAIDGAGRFHVLDYSLYPAMNARIVSFALNGSYLSEYALPDGGGFDMAVDAVGTVHLLYYNEDVPIIRRFSISGEQLAPLQLPILGDDEAYSGLLDIDDNGNTLLGVDEYGLLSGGDWGLLDHRIYTVSPAGIALRVLSERNDLGLTIADDNRMVRLESSANGSIYIARRHDVCRADFNGSYSLGLSVGSSALFTCVSGVAAESDGTIFTVDECTNVLRQFSATGELLASRTGCGGSYAPTFGAPQSVCVDGSGRIFVAEQQNSRAQVLRIEPAPVGVEDGSIGRTSDQHERSERLRLEVLGVARGDGGRVDIAMYLPRDGLAITLNVYDVRGRLVRRLLSGSQERAGRIDIVWDGRGDNGRIVSSGAYVVRAAIRGRESASRKVLIVR